jgi:hypothetical protein
MHLFIELTYFSQNAKIFPVEIQEMLTLWSKTYVIISLNNFIFTCMFNERDESVR